MSVVSILLEKEIFIIASQLTKNKSVISFSLPYSLLSLSFFALASKISKFLLSLVHLGTTKPKSSSYNKDPMDSISDDINI